MNNKNINSTFRPVLLSFIIYCFLLFCGCGPKEPGDGSSWEPPTPVEASGADMMRLPLTGTSNTERMLYYYNKPEVMTGMQKMNRERTLRKMGISPEDPEYRAVPRQRSPFKQ